MNKDRQDIQKQLKYLGKSVIDSDIPRLNDSNNIGFNCITTENINIDFSKQKINKESLEYLFLIPEILDLRKYLKLLFDGEMTNPSEDRKVSHTIYRKKDLGNFTEISAEREKIKLFLEKVRIEPSFKNLICLGIGGSRLGPELIYEFQSNNEPINVHFCSSFDLLELKDVLRHCKQTETYIFVSSKSFKTPEILKNLDFVKSWFSEVPNIKFQDHFYGVSSSPEEMTLHDIDKANQFEILESLGGRFSLWSSMSLPAFVNSDFNCYLDLLEGAELADEHTLTTPWEVNIPVVMALLSVWNRNALKINNHAIFSYNHRLRSLAKYISQVSMESNGKSINFKSEESPFLTSPLIWGGYGVDSQHSTFQWLMQGKTLTSCDFVAINDGNSEFSDSQEVLLSQVIAISHGEEDKIRPFKSIRGNNPCSIIQLNSFDLKSLGFLLSLFEHKTFIEALIVGVDPFDQWGVELGKKLTNKAKESQNFLTKYFSPEFIPKHNL